tara:strand:- start:199 stop:804 length:606 start_codon:yes stop_codon:yes gene_type:complete
MAAGKTTKLEAVNTMLTFIGESPVNSLSDSSGVGDLPIAEQILDEIDREVQSQGWHFNTTVDVVTSPDATSNEIVLSHNVVKADVKVGAYTNMDITMRNNKLFNRSKNTFQFTADLKLTMVSLLPWDDLPEAARRYISLRGARVLQDRQVGAKELTEVGMREELVALASLREYDAEGADYSVFDSYLPAQTISDYRRSTAY